MCLFYYVLFWFIYLTDFISIHNLISIKTKMLLKSALSRNIVLVTITTKLIETETGL